MNFGAFRPLVLALLFIQLCAIESRYCQEAVDSVTIVDSCPTSKVEWDDAARRKDCGRIASKQNCTAAEKFRYHCVINGYRNLTVEVCAPSRIIFGHCVEFNVPGGVIQDQRTAPCKEPFPICANIYNSWEAYKYPHCYQLVTLSEKTFTTTIFPTRSSETPIITEESLGTIVGIIFAAVVLVSFVVGFFVVYKRRRRSTRNKKESMSLVPMDPEEDLRQANRNNVEKAPREDESEALINSDQIMDQNDSQEDCIHILPNIHMHRITPHPSKRRASLTSESCAKKLFRSVGRKRTYSAGF